MPYNGDPLNSIEDRFRLVVGDTDPSNPIFSDGEIEYYLSVYLTPDQAGLKALYSLKAKASHLINENVGGTSKQYSNLIKQYDEMINALERKISQDAFLNASAPMYAGGISHADKDLNEEDTDNVEPFFKRDMHDDHESGLEV